MGATGVWKHADVSSCMPCKQTASVFMGFCFCKIENSPVKSELFVFFDQIFLHCWRRCLRSDAGFDGDCILNHLIICEGYHGDTLTKGGIKAEVNEQRHKAAPEIILLISFSLFLHIFNGRHLHTVSLHLNSSVRLKQTDSGSNRTEIHPPGGATWTRLVPVTWSEASGGTWNTSTLELPVYIRDVSMRSGGHAPHLENTSRCGWS